MSSLEFALTLVIVFAVFLAFALAMLATLLGNKQSALAIRRLLQTTVKTFLSFLTKS